MGAGNVDTTLNTVFGYGGYYLPINESKTLFDMGLKFGYQHYFGESQNHGIRVGLGIGSAVPPIDLKRSGATQELGDPSADPNNPNNWTHYEYENTYKVVPMKVSFELDYLWDFFNRGDHTIGLDVGLGYEMGVWFSKTTNSSLIKEINLKSPTEGSATLLTHTIYPKIGIHYYYGNHQFNVAYKFGGILSGTTKAKEEKFLKGTNADGSPALSHITQTIQSSPSYISFGYSYRF